ncbi:MAG: hypothetical protein NTW05_06970, partial [Pseudonocardiales bacterium]|nr:hypothetical protein [Pseudonocardiales bacterium]
NGTAAVTGYGPAPTHTGPPVRHTPAPFPPAAYPQARAAYPHAPLPPAPPRRRTPLLAGVAAAVVAAAVAVAVAVWPTGGERPPVVPTGGTPTVTTPVTTPPTTTPPTTTPGTTTPTTTPPTSTTPPPTSTLATALNGDGYDPATCQETGLTDGAVEQIQCTTVSATAPYVVFQQFADTGSYAGSLETVASRTAGPEGDCSTGGRYTGTFAGYDITCGTATLDDGTEVYVIAWGSPDPLVQGFVAGTDAAEVWDWWLVHTPF